MEKHNVFVQATPLSGVKGRVYYISSPKKQEHLEAVYSTTSDPKFWHELSIHCQKAAKEAGKDSACEGREFMTLFANELYEKYAPEYLAKRVSEKMKELTGTENVSGVHWNKKKSSYHIHTVCAENPEINLIKKGAVLTRNTYYDSEGKRSKKKDCVDQDGNLLPGCEFIPKGGRKVEKIRFGTKNQEMDDKEFLNKVKETMAELQNELLSEERFQVFIDDGLHLKEQKIGKNKTKEQKAAIIAKNKAVRKYNHALNNAWETSLKDEKMNWEAQRSFWIFRKEVKANAGAEAGVKWVNAVINATGKLNDLQKNIFFQLEQKRLKRLEKQEQMKKFGKNLFKGRGIGNEPVNKPKNGALDDMISGAANRRGKTPSKKPQGRPSERDR